MSISNFFCSTLLGIYRMLENTSIWAHYRYRMFQKQIEVFDHWIGENVGLSDVSQERLLASLAIIFIVYLLRFVILQLVFRKIEKLRSRYKWSKFSGYVAFFVAVILLGRIWFQGFESIATFLGLLSAAMTIALKDLIEDIAGWAFILLRRPFEVGDRVQIGEHIGDVIDIRVFQFTLMEVGNWVDAHQSTGRVIHIPNGRVFTEPQANFNKGFRYIWNEMPILITFESDWKLCKKLLLELVEKHGKQSAKLAEQQLREAARKYMISYSKLTPTVYTSVKDSGILLTLRYLCDPRQRRNSEQVLWEEILDIFAEYNNIDFAYPTTRFFNNSAESKEAKADPDIIIESQLD